MNSLRYIRLWLALARFSLVRELSFRANFLIKVFVESLWLAILLAFNFTIFQMTSNIAGWTQDQYLVFVGCYFAMGGLLETLFLENCNSFADLVRTGDLDFYLIKPIDEQFLLSCRTIDWSCLPNVFMGMGVIGYALWHMSWVFDLPQLLLFLLLFSCGAALAYGFLFTLTAASIWFMRNQSLYEMWWLASTLMRYPKEIFKGEWAGPMGTIFFYVVPIMLVTNVPAQALVRVLDPGIVIFTLVATIVVLFVSRTFFKFALLRYRSASS